MKNFEDCDVLKFAFNFLKVLGQLRAPEAIAKFILFNCVMFQFEKYMNVQHYSNYCFPYSHEIFACHEWLWFMPITKMQLLYSQGVL